MKGNKGENQRQGTKKVVVNVEQQELFPEGTICQTIAMLVGQCVQCALCTDGSLYASFTDI